MISLMLSFALSQPPQLQSHPVQLLRDYALRFVGIHYKWGGNNPLTGMDCSGFIQILLASVGEDPPGDQTAQALYNYFSSNGHATWNHYSMGALAFFGESATKITHVGMLLDQYRMIEAAGGNSRTQTRTDAEDKGAFVKISLLSRRSDLVAILKPYYRKIGRI